MTNVRQSVCQAFNIFRDIAFSHPRMMKMLLKAGVGVSELTTEFHSDSKLPGQAALGFSQTEEPSLLCTLCRGDKDCAAVFAEEYPNIRELRWVQEEKVHSSGFMSRFNIHPPMFCIAITEDGRGRVCVDLHGWRLFGRAVPADAPHDAAQPGSVCQASYSVDALIHLLVPT